MKKNIKNYVVAVLLIPFITRSVCFTWMGHVLLWIVSFHKQHVIIILISGPHGRQNIGQVVGYCFLSLGRKLHADRN